MEIDGKKFALGFGIAWVIRLLVSLGFLGLLAWAIAPDAEATSPV